MPARVRRCGISPIPNSHGGYVRLPISLPGGFGSRQVIEKAEMQTLGQEMLRQGFYSLLDVHGRSLQSLTTPNVTFTGLMATADVFEAATELGDDVREVSKLEVLAPGPALNRDDLIGEVGTDNQWTVVKRTADQSDITVKYWCVKVLDDLDL